MNDGKHFLPGANPHLADKKKERIYGALNEEKVLVFYHEECKVIKKLFEPLYSNNLQFKGKVLQEQKAMKVMEAEYEAR